MPEGHLVMRGKVVLDVALAVEDDPLGTLLPGIKAVPRGKLFPGLKDNPLCKTLLAVKNDPP